MSIRTFQAGDDVAQVSIYNEAAAELPKFKPATVDEIRRRCRAPDFDPSTRFYAIANGRPVAYITFQPNGRISFPWCRKGQEANALPLFTHALQAMRDRGLRQVFAAYRGDWTAQRDFFLNQGFVQVREMINSVMDLVDMPTPAARAGSAVTPLTPADVPRVAELGAGVLRTTDPAALEAHLFHNPYFPPNSLFTLRSKADDLPVAVGNLVTGEYADPKQIDSGMPCFRLGAFGTEGMTHKRIKGLFSILAADTRDLTAHGLDLLNYATQKLESTNIETLAAQVPSDAPHLVRFYKSLFRRQGTFPIYQRDL